MTQGTGEEKEIERVLGAVLGDPVAVAAFMANVEVLPPAVAAAEAGAIIADQRTGVVRSVRFYNLVINWPGTLIGLAGLAASVPFAGNPGAAYAAAANGLIALAGAALQEFGGPHKVMLLALWRDRPTITKVRHGELKQALAHDMSGDEFEDTLNDLLILGVVDLEEGEWIVKHDRLYLQM